MQQPPQNPEQPSYPYQPQQTGPGMPPPPQYQQEPYSQYQPNYYMPPPPLKKSNKTLWIVLGVVVGGLLVVSLAICGIIVVAVTNTASTAVNNIAATVTVDTSTSTSSSSSSDNQVSKVGGTITLNGVQATLVSVKTSPGGQYDTPKSGNEYVIVHVKLNNTSNKEQSYNEFDFHVKSGSGNITQQDYLSTENNSDLLNSGTLSAGGSTEGDLVFQVKIGDHKAELTWQPSYFGNAGDNGWNLGL
jgi:hypothetical protein